MLRNLYELPLGASGVPDGVLRSGIEKLIAGAAASQLAENADDEKDDLADTSEFAWQDNKYKPQQQEQYLTILKSEVRLPNHAYWVARAKDDQRLLKTFASTGGADLPFPIGCKTDECVALSRSTASVEASFAATVEIKKKVV
ncbi:hypothetical protein WJX75_004743 [Coccomyxa subellipsoidea]|uniref:Uncharacterized protein n=1 Tax=Coccomyxa subellipsoidea TaxID=248742 RepID=A0ABR2Z401_9CHLO